MPELVKSNRFRKAGANRFRAMVDRNKWYNRPGRSDPSMAQPQEPLPAFSQEDYYANSDEFQGLLIKTKTQGFETLNAEEQGRVKTAVQLYPQVADFLKDALDEKKEDRTEDILKDVHEKRAEGLANLIPSLVNLGNKFEKWVESPTEFEHTLGQPEFIPEIAEAAAKGAIKFPAHMAQMTWDDMLKFGPVVAAVRFASGIAKFPFQVGTDLFNMFGAGIPSSAQIGDVPIEDITAPTSEEVIEQYKQDPTPIILAALPILKIARSHFSKYPMAEARIQDPMMEQIERAEKILEEDYQRMMKAEMDEAAGKVEGKEAAKKEKPAIPATVEPQFEAIQKMPAGDLLSEALELQKPAGETGYSGAELVKMYGADRGYVEYIVSGGRIGKEPPARAEIGKLPKGEPTPPAPRPVETIKKEIAETRKKVEEVSAIETPEAKELEQKLRGRIAEKEFQGEQAELEAARQDISKFNSETKPGEIFESFNKRAEKEEFRDEGILEEEYAASLDKYSDAFEDVARKSGVPEDLIESARMEFSDGLGMDKNIDRKVIDIARDAVERYEGDPAKVDPKYLDINAPVEKKVEAAPVEPPKVETVKPSDETIEKPVLKETEIEFAERGMKPVDEINIDPDRFQPRIDPFAMNTYERLNTDFNAGKLDDIVIWKDPKDGNYYALNHSRFEFLKDKANQGKIKGGRDIPYRVFEGTEKEAIDFAHTSNVTATMQEASETIRTYRRFRQDGLTEKEIAKQMNLPSKLLGDYDAWSRLNPKGEFMRYIAQEIAGSGEGISRVKAFGRWVGELRKDFPVLTDAHETQIFDWLYRSGKKNYEINKDVFVNKIDRLVKDIEFDPGKALQLVAEEELKGKAKATPSGREMLKKLEEMESQYDKAVTVGEKQALLEKLTTLRQQIREAIDREQVSLFDQMFAGMEQIKPEQKIGGGLGGINPFRDLREQFAESLMRAERKREAGIAGHISDVPSLFVSTPKDIGLLSRVRTPSNVLGSIPGQKKRYGHAAAEAHQRMMLKERDIKVEAGTRGAKFEDILSRVDKNDRGKNWDKFYDHVVDPSKDGELTPSSLQAAKELRQVMEQDWTRLMKWNRDDVRPSMKKIVEREYRQTHDLVGKQLKDEHLGEIAEIVEARLEERFPEKSRIENYLPQMHPGHFDLSVIEFTEDGPVTNWIGAARNQMQAVKKITEWYADHPEVSPDAFTITPRMFRGDDVMRTTRKNYYRIINKIADDAEGMVSKESIADALRGTVGVKEGKKKFASFTQKREGFEGYSKNLPDVLATYNQSYVRHMRLTELMREVQPLIDQVKRERRPNTAGMLEETLEYLWGKSPSITSQFFDASLQSVPVIKDYTRPMALERWTGYAKTGTNVTFLKINPRFHLLNRLQTYQTLFPEVTIKEWRDGSRFYSSKEGRAAMEQFGVGYLSGGKAIEGGKTWTGMRLREKLARKSAGIGAPETFNQEFAWSVMFKRAKTAGLSDFAANDYAFLRGQVYTQFAHLAADVPPSLRGPITSTMFQFKRFPIKDLELGLGMIADKRYAGAAKWLGAKLLFGGAKIVTKPLTAIPVVGATVAYITAEQYERVKQDQGEHVADAIAYGLPGLLGMDMSYSFLLTDLPYGGSVPEKLGNLMLGPIGNTLVSLGSAAYSKDVGLEGAAERVGQKAMQKIPGLSVLEALDAFQKKVDEGEYRFEDPDGRLKFKADLKEVIIKGMGGRTTKEAEIDILTEALTSVEEQRDMCIERSARKLIEWYDGKAEYDDVLKDYYDWNELWGGEFPIMMENIKTRAKAKRQGVDLDRFDRMMKNAPKVFRYNQLFQRRGQ